MNIPAFLYFFNLLWASPSVVLSRGVDRHNVAQFKVNSLPGISSLPSSWAGRLPVPGAKKGNEIFFWLFDSEKPAYDDNLISKFHGGYWRNSLLTLFSLVQRRSGLLFIDRASNRQWPVFVRWKLYKPRSQSSFMDTTGQCALC